MDFNSAVEFSFGNEPVGLVDCLTARVAPGAYDYEPYRGPGHYRLAQALDESGSAECWLRVAGGTVRFTVSEMKSGKLVVSRVAPSNSAGAA